MKTLGIIGSGDLGQQIAYYALNDGHYNKVLFFDDYDEKAFGKINEVKKAYGNKEFDELLIGIGYKHLNFKLQLETEFKDLKFGRLIHSSSYVDSSAKIADGVIIYPCCNIDANVEIGSNTLLNIGVTVAHDTKIENCSFLSPSVSIAGFVSVGSRCILGINSTVIDNITICDETQLGGGTVVIKSIDKKGLYVGNPARFIRDI